MPTIDPIQASFAGGEFSPSIYSRVDIDKYRSGLRTARNFIIHPQGGVSNRCGFQYISSARYSGSMCVTQEFIFNQTQAYALEFGHKYVRFYTDGAQITSGGSAYTVATPYLVGDLNELKFEASADVIWITHPSYQTMTLTRYAETDWQLDEYEPDDGPFMPINIDESASLSVAAVTGTTTLSLATVTSVNTEIVFLSHFDGLDAATAATDSSSYGRAITFVGNAQLDTAQKKFGSASLLLDGTGDYITLASSTDLDMGTSDFTYGAFLMQAVSGTTQRIFSRTLGGGSIDQIYCQINSSNILSIAMQSATGVNLAVYDSTDTVDLTGSFHDLLVVRSGSNIKAFLDGTEIPMTVGTAIGTSSMAVGTSVFAIGASAAGANGFNGWIDDFIIIKGTALQTADYTVPTSAYSTLTTSSIADFVFDPLHVGALFKLTHYIQSQTLSVSASSATGASSSIKCFTTWRLITHGTWTAKFRVEKSSDGGTTWTTLRAFSGANDFNPDTSGTEDIENNPVPFLLRVNVYSYTSGTLNIDLSSDPFYQDGIVRATAYISPTALTVTVLDEVGSTSNTTDWSEGSWSNYRGWPAVARFFQDRLCFAATPSEPQTTWMTVIGNYYSFLRHQTLLDTDAITVNLPSRQINQINGLIAFKQLLAFTSSAIWSIGPTTGTALTPTSVQQNIEEYNGSADVVPVVVGSEAVYNQTGGEIVRNIGFQLAIEGFTGSEANILAYHLFQGYTITRMAYQKNPNNIIWCLRSDGVLLSFTYNREQQVVAWAHHDTDGTVESICCIPGDESDELWISVNRDNGRFIEKMIGRKQFNLDNHVFMDSYTLANSSTYVVSSLVHLANQEVSIIADDEVLDQQTVSSLGRLTIARDTYSVLQLPFDGDDAATTATDYSRQPKTVTFVGNAQLDTAQKKFGTASLSLDGNGDYCTVPDSDDFCFEASDSRFRTWVMFNNTSGAQTFISQYLDNSNYWLFQKNSGTHKLTIQFVSGGSIKGQYTMTNAWAPSTGVWYFLEGGRSGTSCYISIDGVIQTLTEDVAIGTNNVGNVAGTLYIGQKGNAAGYVNGWMDDLQISKGLAPNTTDFDVPEEANEDALYETVYLGLPYDADFETLNIEVPVRTGTLQGSKIKVGNVTFRLINTRGGFVGPNENTLYEAFSYEELNRANLVQYNTTLGVTSNFSGDMRVLLGGEYSPGGRIFYRQTDPLPVSIGAVVPEFDPGGVST